ncbi:pyridoxamine 5'-phosphate oxidase family protein [Natrarchaeobius halalkaliphilus]|uniref:Pyridoxamine 5'-phosphate oxidase family protein n=1 Tax=Natrarchaeobius halalkaliphilus TaxID=1679091 RepID=A0A3N6P6L1_9EURY|nr:pyridoxamine 5'-phosphate oxidase family protein [Natrarchaeobius halalkaliphilus]RQG91475.1 pyridoxamine 5'-phosphate oxidase family protein [Natrarchaeobius halalkaliphilus]
MDGLRWVQLTDRERTAFLGTGGTGVLSFGTESTDPPASLPVSYGYFDDDQAFYFRLSFPEGTTKDDVIENPVSFVTHGETDDGWRSVIATGTLEELGEFPHESVEVQGMWAVDIPKVDVFDRPRDEIPFHDFRLDPERLTGRKSVTE